MCQSNWCFQVMFPNGLLPRWLNLTLTSDNLNFLVYQSGVQFALLYFSYLNTSGVLDHPLTTDSTTPDSTISILHFGQLQTMVLLITWVARFNILSGQIQHLLVHLSMFSTYKIFNGWAKFREISLFSFSCLICHFWGKITKIITGMNFRIFKNSSYLRFLRFSENSHYRNDEFPENRENHI